MNRYDICKKAHQMRDEILDTMIALDTTGKAVPNEMKMDYMFYHSLCRDMVREENWKEYQAEVYGATYPEGEEPKRMAEMKEGYHHNVHESKMHDVDKEISRIIEHGDTAMMVKLSEILSEMFEDMQSMMPIMYENVHNKLKDIRY